MQQMFYWMISGDPSLTWHILETVGDDNDRMHAMSTSFMNDFGYGYCGGVAITAKSTGLPFARMEE